VHPSDVDLRSGRVTQWQLDSLNANAPLDSQLDVLTEDLAQIEFGNGSLVDVGWYPECSRDGSFIVVAVRASDWDSPIFKATCTSMAELRTSIQAAVQAAMSS